ncbi:MAG: hypothetical protein IRY86_14140, partial [Thermorudis peleae]|nr:hypothetical protein [Thermorudis peleae]
AAGRSPGHPTGPTPWWATPPTTSTVLDPTETTELARQVGLPLSAEQPATGVRHHLVDGRTLWAVAAPVAADEVVVVYRDSTGQQVRMRYQIAGTHAVLVGQQQADGQWVTRPTTEAPNRARPDSGFDPGSGGSDIECGPFTVPCTICCGLNIDQVLHDCGTVAALACAPLANRNILAYIACILAVCGPYAYRDCTQWCSTCCSTV